MKISTKLRIIYAFTAFLSLFMLMWILVLPATVFLDTEKKDTIWNRIHQKAGFNILNSSPFMPPRILSKYDRQTLVQFTHQIPGAVWVACIPLQFHPSIRRTYLNFHRYVGRLFVTSSFVCMMGAVVIHMKKLSTENFLEGVEIIMLPLPFLNISVISFWECMTGAWFIYTVSESISYVRRKEIQNHQIWIVRHVASGLWVAVQRLLMGPSAFATNKIAALIGANVTAGYKHRIIFYAPMLIGQCVTFGVGEYAVHLLGKNMKKGKRA
uniref:Uncharacterized protein n=1 Tax=Chaetoceros debilis TaxID=122233 RepID=A0A7S3PVE7_9STRA